MARLRRPHAHADSTPVTADTLSTKSPSGSTPGLNRDPRAPSIVIQPDGDGQVVRPGDPRHPRERRGAFGVQAVRLQARQRDDLPALGRRHSRALAASPIAGGRVRDPAAQSRGRFSMASPTTALLPHQEICKGAGSDQLRICVSAGGAAGAYRRALAQCGRCRRARRLGSTEMLSTFLSNRPGDIRFDGQRPRIRRARCRRARARGCVGEIGELIVRRPSVGEGY